MEVFTNSASILVSSLGGLYLLALLLRFLLQLARADFYNPVSQAAVKVTDPLVRVVRNFVPGYRGIDFSCIFLALLIEAILIVALVQLAPAGTRQYFEINELIGIGSIVSWSVIGIVSFIVNIYYYAIIAAIIMSFVMMFSGARSPHPALRLIWQLTEPVMTPFRKLLPPMGGLDFSPIFIFIGISIVKSILVGFIGANARIASVIIGI